MASSYTPPTNLHSPGPIGDVAPDTLGGTSLLLTKTTEQERIRYDVNNYLGVAIGSNGRPIFTAVGTSPAQWQFILGTITDGLLLLDANAGCVVTAGIGVNSCFVTTTAGARSATVCRFSMNGSSTAGGTGLSDGNADNTIGFMMGGTVYGTFTTTKLSLASGVALQLGNSAVTGLIAGALAALTTASIVIYDSTGTAYRVPCITP